MRYALFFVLLLFTSSHALAQGVIRTLAGTGQAGFSGDGGPASQAMLSGPRCIVADSFGNLYIADTGNQRIRKIDAAGNISTVVTGISLLAGWNNLASDAAGNLYFPDYDHNVVKKLSPDGTITVVAGNGKSGSLIFGGLAIDSPLLGPGTVAVDSSGQVFFGYANGIAKVDSQGMLRSVETGYSPDGMVLIPDRYIYFTQSFVATLWRVASDGSAVPALIAQPPAIHIKPVLAVDSSGALYATLSNYLQVVLLAPDFQSTTVVAGSTTIGTASGDGGPATFASFVGTLGGIFVAGGNLFIADTDGNVIRKVLGTNPVPALDAISVTSALAGSAGFNLTATATNFAGNAVLQWNGTPVATTPISSTQLIASIAASNIATPGVAQVTLFNPTPGGGSSAPITFDVAASCQYVFSATDITFTGVSGSGSLSVSAPLGCNWTAMSNASWIAITAGGSGNGNGTVSYSIAANTTSSQRSGTLTVAGQTITITQVPPSVSLGPSNLNFVAYAGDVSAVHQLTLTANGPATASLAASTANGVAWITFGSPTATLTTAGSAHINVQIGATNLAAGSYQGTITVSVPGGNPSSFEVGVTVEVSALPPAAIAAGNPIVTVAGTGSAGFSGDGGPATLAALNGPSSIAFDGTGNLYIADSGNLRVRKVNGSGIISTILVTDYGFTLAVDPNGNVYFTSVYYLKKFAPDAGTIITVAGSSDYRPFPAIGVSVPATSVSLYLSSTVDYPSVPLTDFKIDSSNRLILSSGRYVAIVDGGMLTPVYSISIPNYRPAYSRVFGVATDVLGKIYMTERVDNWSPVVQFDPATGLSSTLRLYGNSTSLVVDTSGNLFMCSQSGLVRMTIPVGWPGCADCQPHLPVAQTAVAAECGALAFDAAGNLYTSGANVVRKIVASGGPPAIILLSPSRATAGSPTFTLTVNGLNFATTSVVRWNGLDRPTTFVNTSQLTAVISAGDVSLPGTALVTVFNPGVGLSGSVPFSIVQGCTYLLSPNSVSAPSGVSSGSISVIAPTGCAWTAQSNVSWIGVSSGATGTGDGSVAYTITGNGDTKARTGTLTVAGLTFTVNQAGSTPTPCNYALSADSVSAPSGASSGSFTVTAPAGCAWTAQSNVSWLGISSGASGTGNGSVFYTVAANANTSARTGTLTVAGLTFTVNQAGSVQTALTVSPAEMSFTAPAGSTTVLSQQAIVTSSSAVFWSASATTANGINWLSVAPLSGSTPAAMSVQVDPANLGAGTYNGTVLVSSANAATKTMVVQVTVTPAQSPQLAVEPAALNLHAIAGSGMAAAAAVRIANTGGGSVNWTALIVGNANWLSLSSGSGTASNSAPSAIQAVANVVGLSTGTYTATVRIEAAALKQSRDVPVTLTVAGSAQHVVLSTTSLAFVAVVDSNSIPARALAVLNTGQGTMNWTAKVASAEGGNWLSVSPSSGSSDAAAPGMSQLAVAAKPVGLKAGRYTGLVEIDAPGADNAPLYAQVELTVLPQGGDPGTLVLPSGLIFVARSGDTNAPPAQAVQILTSLTGSHQAAVGISTQDGGSWLRVSASTVPFNSVSPGTLSVQPSASTLIPVVYRGTVVLLLDNGETHTVSVLLVVVPSTLSSGRPATLSDSVLATSCMPTKLLGVNRTLPAGISKWNAASGTIEVQVVDDCGNAVSDATVVAALDNGDSPFTLASLQNGIYSSAWRPFHKTGSVTVSVRVLKPPLAEADLPPVILTLPDLSTGTLIYRGGLVNAASYAPGQPVSPGSLITVFGRNLAPGQNLAGAVPLPASLAGMTLTIAGKQVPLLFTSPGQVNAQLPFEVNVNATVQAVVSGPNGISLPEPIAIAPAQPGIFSVDATGQGQGVIVDPNYKLIDASHPVKAGDYAILYCTGLGPTDLAVPGGSAAPLDRLANVTTAVRVTIGGQPAILHFAGLAPGWVGLYQVNVQVPSGVTPGPAVPVVITQNGISSNAVTMAVQ